MDDEETELRNPFPSPPSHYTNYTTHNLTLLKLLRERAGDVDLAQVNQNEVLADQTDVPEWPLVSLEKPRVDWIIEEGEYTVFGDTWLVKERIATLAELGGHQLYPADPSFDRRPALLTILKSMMVTYSLLLKALLAPPPTTSSIEAPVEWRKHSEWITIMSQNLMAAANDLRPVQARGHLESMMRRQLELRRQETADIHAKCDLLEAKLNALSNGAMNVAGDEEMDVDEAGPSGEGARAEGRQNGTSSQALSIDDVLRWAEEVG